MKRALFIFIALIAGWATARAQTEKGTLLLSGNLNYSYQKLTIGKYEKTTQALTLQPQLGYFVANNLALGIAPVFIYNHVSNTLSYTPGPNSRSKLLGGGLFMRYYWMFTDKIGLYPQLGVNYSDAISHDDPSRNFDATIRPNLVFFPARKLGLSLGMGSLGYTYQKNSEGDLNKTFGISASGNNLTLGVSYHW